MCAQQVPQSVSARSNVGILLFVLCCQLSTGHLLFRAAHPTRINSDDVPGRSDQRFAALKARLPARGIVGYIGETGDSAIPDYYLTQYALAPLVIDYSPDRPLVIGNFPASRPSVIPRDLHLVEDFGNGVMLFAAKDQQ